MKKPNFYFWHYSIKGHPWPDKALILPKKQAHRGYHSEKIQENTLDAFHSALTHGAEMCELDVQLSQDQIPVVFHDKDLLRIKSCPDKVENLSAQELQRLAMIPTLESVLEDPLCPRFWNIEIKSNKINDPLFFATSKIIQKTQSESCVMISSFNPFALFWIEKYLPNVPRALLVSSERHPENKFYLRDMLLAPFLKLHMLNLEKTMINPRTIDFWKQQKMPLSAWTLTTHEEVEKLHALGLQSLICDPPIFAS